MDAGSIKFRGDGDEHRFDDVLASLKTRGCSILVAGSVPITTSRVVSKTLFGHPDERRERVLLRFHQTNSLEAWFPSGVGLDDPRVHVVDCIDPGRSATGAGFGSNDYRWHSSFDPTEIPCLSRRQDVDACADEIVSITTRAGRLEPGQLRVGLFSLNELDDHSDMVDVVSTIATPVIATRGMVHFHLGESPDSDAVQTVTEHVDARITVRKNVPGRPPEQKWTVTGYGETPWVPMTPPE